MGISTNQEARVLVSAPASLSNLGPGFDTFGLCIEGIADQVVATRTEDVGVAIAGMDGFSAGIPADGTNTAAVGARIVLQRSGLPGGIELRIRKGIRIGSGIGGSAASAAAGAVAANEVLGGPLLEIEVVQAALEAEQSVAGALHGDNVLPCLFGGFVLTTPADPLLFQRYEVGDGLIMPLLLPHFSVLTENARQILPKVVPLMDAAHTASSAAHAVAALLSEDWRAFGAAIMEDRLVEPHRAGLIDFYDAVKEAALSNGALGCALSGSGPAMFAVADSSETAESVADAMLKAIQSLGFDGDVIVARASNEGVRVTRQE